MPGASAAAQLAWKVSGAGLRPGVSVAQELSACCTSSESPAGDQLNPFTLPLSKSCRGKPDSLTSQRPAGDPAAEVVKVIQPCSGLTGPVVKVTARPRSSALPSTSIAASPTCRTYF